MEEDSALGQSAMKTGLTKREIIVLIILGILFPLIAITPQSTIEENELFLLILIVAPLGFLIATDPERIRKG